jgi:hypothetical protein
MEAEGELRQLEREDVEASPMDRARAVRDFMGGWRARDRGPVQCAGGEMMKIDLGVVRRLHTCVEEVPTADPCLPIVLPEFQGQSCRRRRDVPRRYCYCCGILRC